LILSPGSLRKRPSFGRHLCYNEGKDDTRERAEARGHEAESLVRIETDPMGDEG
jgi:hypothetical protein